MTTPEFLAGLRERDIRLWVEQDRLKCSAPAGAMDPELKAELASRKDEIITLLRQAEVLRHGPSAIIPLKPEGRRPPLFAIPGHNGDVFCYVNLARHLEAEQPLLGVQPPGLDGAEPLRSIEELANHDVDHIRRYRPQGPYLIAGYCAGGTVAFEVARQLAEQRQHVALLALFASPFPTTYRWTPRMERWIRDLRERAERHLRVLASGSMGEGIDYLGTKVRGFRRNRAATRDLRQTTSESRHRVGAATIAAVERYAPRPYPGEIDLFLPSAAWRHTGFRPDRWKELAARLREHHGPDGCDGDVILREPNVSATASLLRRRLDEIWQQA